MHGSDGTVALFSDDHLGFATIFLRGIVVFLPQQENYHIGILLDGPGFAEIRKLRPLTPW